VLGTVQSRGRARSTRADRRSPWPLLVALLGFLALFLWPDRALANPDYKLRTLETEHFYIHYYAGEEEVADRVAMNGERAYRDLTALFAHEPALKTHVVIEDRTDSANGFANAVPFPRITLFAVAPDSMSVLGSYDDWLDILVTHEFVHVVHIDTVHGLPRVLNALLGFGVLGKSNAPNIIQPRWIIEGVATMHESDLGSQGRHRSAIFDMFLRMAVLEKRFQAVDQVSGAARVYPFGSTAYLYGLHMMHWIGTNYGQDKLAEMSHIYGGRLMPFGINRAVEDVIGVDFEQLWSEFSEDLDRRFHAQARQIRGRGLRQGRRLTFNISNSSGGGATRKPFWSSDDEWIYFYDDDSHGGDGIHRVPAAGARIREGFGMGSQGRSLDIERILEIESSATASPVGANEDDLVFDMTGRHDYRYSWSDLYRWRGGDKRHFEQLTFGMRAREPEVSPDGRTVAYARTDVAQSRLAFLRLDTLETTEVAPHGRISQVYEPTWSKDGTKIAYSGWREGGFRDIYVYDRFAGTTERITSSRAMDISPEFTPDGRYLLFSSDRTGVFNVHAFDLETHEVFQVTNVLGGAFEVAINHDGTRLVYVGYGSSGYDLWGMDFDPEKFLPAMPEQTGLPQAKDPTPEIPGTRGRKPSDSSKRYRSYRTMFPRALMPAAIEFESSEFLTGLGISALISDVVGYHVLAAYYNYLIDYRESVGRVSYSFNRLIPNFAFSFERNLQVNTTGFTRYIYDPPPGSELSPDDAYRYQGFRERSTGVRGAMTVPILRHLQHGVSMEGRYRFVRIENLDAADDVIDPNAPTSRPPFEGDEAGVSLELGYSNAQGHRYAFGSDRGRAVSVSVSVLDRALGSDVDSVAITGAYIERIRMPWRGAQVLAFRLSGGTRSRGNWSIGGFPTGQDVVRTMLQRGSLSQIGMLRGYSDGAFRGTHFVLLNAEYRMPLFGIDRGPGSMPVMFRGMTLVPFTDWGLAWSDPIEPSDMMGSIGTSLVFDFNIGYGDLVSLYLQYAHGWEPRLGLDYFRVLVSRSF
jgi:hypothetical protein